MGFGAWYTELAHYMTLIYQGQVKSKNSRSNKKIIYFVIKFPKCVNICPGVTSSYNIIGLLATYRHYWAQPTTWYYALVECASSWASMTVSDHWWKKVVWSILCRVLFVVSTIMLTWTKLISTEFPCIETIVVETVIQNNIQEANDDDDDDDDDDLISCSESYARSIRAANIWTDKASRSHDDIRKTLKGSRLAITSTCIESHDPIFLCSMAR